MKPYTTAQFSYKVYAYLAANGLFNITLWQAWTAFIIVVVLALSATFDFAPYLFRDELMNVDLGRTIFHPNTDWSIAWMADESQPVFLLTYLGPALQEASYLLVGETGPRIIALLGGIIAASVTIAWIIKRGTLKAVAFILSSAFLLDPIFVQAYTTGRVDGWAIAFCIASCLVLRNTASSFEYSQNIKAWTFFAGVLASIAFFIWASAVFLFPLILLELIYLIKISVAGNEGRKVTLQIPILFLGGGLVAALLLLLPIAHNFIRLFYDVIEALQVNTQHGGKLEHQEDDLSLFLPFIDLLRNLKFTPILAIVALIGMIWKRDWGIIFSTLIVAALMMSTLVYICRVLYLLPYLVASAALIYQSIDNKGKILKLKALGPVLILAWSVGLSLFARTLLAFNGLEDRNNHLLNNAAYSMIGLGSHSVALLNSFEFYYVGRSLGWKMYAPYIPAFENISQTNTKEILAKVNYVILPEEILTDELALRLREEGMINMGIYNLYENPVDKEYIRDYSKTTNINRVQSLYKIDRQPYGPYRLFVRENTFVGQIGR